MEKKLLQRKKGKQKGWVHATTYNNHNGEKGKCFEKNQSFANIVTNLNSHNGHEKSINLNHDQSKLQG
jgi:hypothetical protein